MKDKNSLLPGLMLFTCFIILTVCSLGFDFAFSRIPSLGIMIVELLAFVPPTYCLYKAQDRQFRLNFRTNKKISDLVFYLGFTFWFALAVSFFSFLANLLIYVVIGSSNVDLSSMITTVGVGNQYNFLSFFAIVVFSPVCEELFVHGALFSAFERKAGTVVSIILSGICFAMLHGSLYNFIGPLIAGCAYALLVYCFDSIWPAIFAHVINNCYYYIINYLISLYSSFGIWKYFTYINIILFLLALYMTLRALETQVRRRSMRAFQPNRGKMTDILWDCLVNPGFFIFVSSFAVSVALK